MLPWLKHQTQSSRKTYKNHLCQTAAIALKGWSSITGLERRCKESGWEKSDSDCWCVFCVCVSFLFWPPNNGTLREISGLEIPDTWKNTSKPLFLAGSSDVWQRLIRILPKRNIKAFWLKKMAYQSCFGNTVDASTVWCFSINTVIVTLSSSSFTFLGRIISRLQRVPGWE